VIRILGCIVQQHDLQLLGFAAAVCCLACFTTRNMLGRAASSQERVRTAWLLAAALVFGCGVWTTHFVAMLAFISDLIVGYSVPLTVLSFLLVCGGGAAAFRLALSSASRLSHVVGAGTILGCSVAAMHYCGMSAMWLEGTKSFQPGYVVASVGAAVLLSCLALREVSALQSLQRTASRRPSGRGRGGAALHGHGRA
jgi:NO-binding membrane sensor protein with MHYT domain